MNSEETTQKRRDAVNHFKRSLLQDAALRVFAERGLANASIREIVKAAGYSTGAFYAHYESKEEIYADLLRSSLDRMRAHLTDAFCSAPNGSKTEFCLMAWFEFFEQNPVDYDLGFYLHGGAKPAGLGRQLNAELNHSLKQCYDCLAQAISDDGLDIKRQADELSAQAASVIFGLFLMKRTKRFQILGIDESEVVPNAIFDFINQHRH